LHLLISNPFRLNQGSFQARYVLSLIMLSSSTRHNLPCYHLLKSIGSIDNSKFSKEDVGMKQAYKKGLLSEKEYKDARKNLMKKYND
jgi:hypothetical protein